MSWHFELQWLWLMIGGGWRRLKIDLLVAVREVESGAAAAAEVTAAPPKPASYKDILQMLEQGKTPPGIRVCPTRRSHQRTAVILSLATCIFLQFLSL